MRRRDRLDRSGSRRRRIADPSRPPQASSPLATLRRGRRRASDLTRARLLLLAPRRWCRGKTQDGLWSQAIAALRGFDPASPAGDPVRVSTGSLPVGDDTPRRALARLSTPESGNEWAGAGRERQETDHVPGHVLPRRGHRAARSRRITARAAGLATRYPNRTGPRPGSGPRDHPLMARNSAKMLVVHEPQPDVRTTIRGGTPPRFRRDGLGSAAGRSGAPRRPGRAHSASTGCAPVRRPR